MTLVGHPPVRKDKYIAFALKNKTEQETQRINHKEEETDVSIDTDTMEIHGMVVEQ